MAAIEQEVKITEPRPVKSGFWDQWIGKQMVFQTKSHAIIRGRFKEFRNSFLFIKDATITGAKKVVKPKVVMIDRNFLSHFHEESPVEDKPEGEV